MSLAGKVLCFTGTLSTMKRAEATQKAKDAGAEVAGSLTKKVNVLVCGGSQTENAKSATAGDDVERWTETDFVNALTAATAKKPAAKKAAPKASAAKKAAAEPAAEKPAPKPAAKKAAAKTKQAEEAKDESAPPAKAAPKPEVAAGTPAATPGNAGPAARVVDRLVPNREQYTIVEDYAILLNQTNIGQNNNKYYIIQLLQRGDSYFCWTRWGRVGEPGQNALIPGGTTLAGGVKVFAGKFKDKTSNDWTARANFTPKSGKYTIVEMDEKDGDSGGDSKAPMGKLSRGQIEKGQAVLAEISAAIGNNMARGPLVELSSKFFTLIPTNFGRQVPTPLTQIHQVNEKEELLKFYLRMGFEEVDKEDVKLPPLSGVMDLPIPKTLEEAIGSAADKNSIKNSVSKGDALAKKQAGSPIRPMNKEEYGSIMLYTSNAIYRDLNKVLRDENRLGVKRYFSYLRLLFAAADALPQKNVTLWRGISVDLSQQYKEGHKIVWWGVSSCTSDQQVARNFMNGCGGDCTFLTIDTKTAVDISQITFYSNEKESLLMPGTELLVKKVSKKGKIAEIHLEEVGRLLN